MANDTILAMFSGGIDSTGVLHQLFTHPDFADNPVIIHHVILQNRENRAAAELQAVEQIVKYYAQTFPDREYLYTDCVFNTMGFAPLNSTRFPFDMDVCAFIAGNICVARKDIKQVAMGRTSTDLASGGENFKQRMARAQQVFQAVHSLEQEAVPEYIFPVVEMSKEEIWQMLPDPVKESSWYCRHPRYLESGIAVTCKQCQTCKEVAEFL